MSTQPTVRPLDPTSSPAAGPDAGNGNGETPGHTVSQGLKDRLRGLDDVVADTEAPRRSLRLVIVLGLLVTLTVAGVGGYLAMNVLDDPWKDLEVQPVTRGEVIFSVIEKGELEAAYNVDIFCKVRASGRGNSVASSIKWVIDNGTFVRKGDVLALLDDSALKEQRKSQISIVAEKKSALIQAEVNKQIVESQNQIDLQTAENNVKIAGLDLTKYVEGDLIQKQKDLEGKVTLGHSDLLQWRDKVMTGLRMLKKGYVTSSQAQSDEARMRKAEIDLENFLEQTRVLDKYESERNRLDFQNKLEQAKVTEKNTRIQAKGKSAEAEAKYQAALSVLEQEEAKLNDLEEDIQNCSIKAPSEGMCVYYVSEESRRGFSQQQSLVAVGESVRENQKLMRIPDLRIMQVQIKIHESLVPRLRADQVRKNSQGEEEVVNPGQPGLVKLSAVDRPLRGHLKFVSPMSSQGDWMSTDVKTYPTVVIIDEPAEELKPGMNAEVTILLDERTDVLRLPVHAVLEVGGERFCYVKTTSGVEKRKLVTGLNNSRFIEIREGSDLKEGDQVVQTPRIVADKLDHLRAETKDPADKLRGTDKGKKTNGPNGGPPADSPGKPERRRGEGKPKGEFGGPGFGGPGAGPGGPGAAPGGPGAGQGPGGGGFQMSPEQRAKYEKEMADLKDTLKKAKTAADRKTLFDKHMKEVDKRMAERVPDETQRQQFMPFIRQRLKDELAKDGIEIPD